MDKVLVICGPTCVGKTSLSINLAKALNGEIINGDSMQVYKEMNVGTAKISEKEKEGIAHHLFDIKNIQQSFSVAEFQKLIRQTISETTEKHKLPIIVGGTGLYLKAGLYDYLFQENQPTDYKLDVKTTEELYLQLQELDEKTALTIHPNNRKRIIRAIELFYETGVGKEGLNKLQEHKPLYDVIYIGLTRPRSELYTLIDERVDKMMSQGLEQEARYVLTNASANSTALQAIGYKEFRSYLEGNSTLEEVAAAIKSNTHKFAKRQYTWFNHQMDVKWIDVQNKTIEQIEKEALTIIESGWNNG